MQLTKRAVLALSAATAFAGLPPPTSSVHRAVLGHFSAGCIASERASLFSVSASPEPLYSYDSLRTIGQP